MVWRVLAAPLLLGFLCGCSDGRDLPAAAAVDSTRPMVATSGPVAATSEPVVATSGPVAPTSERLVATAVPVTTTPPATGGSGVVPVGFATVAGTVTAADGEVCEVCLWLAATPEHRSRGLMEVTDLGPADGMVFRYGTATATSFWMRNTPMPLSIAFFDADGRYLDAFDMEPCGVGDCPLHPTPSGFVDAVELAQGTLDRFGIGPGSVLELTDLPCG